MEIGSILLALALSLLVIAFVARPFLEKAAPSASTSQVSDLVTQREAVLTELRDLDFDHATGKLAEDDYQQQRARLIAHGADILRALDRLPAPPQAAPLETAVPQPTSASSSLDAEIEQLVAARRQKPAPATAGTCPNCHKPIQPNDNFCPSCGAKLT